MGGGGLSDPIPGQESGYQCRVLGLHGGPGKGTGKCSGEREI